ncbi:30S ribosomal protein S8 [bacterium]|nr:30S ribosomal protein S8 [bacterium]
MINDHLSDFLTRLRNAGLARHTQVDTFMTKMNEGVAEILSKEGYIKSFKPHQEGTKNYLRLFLKYEGGDLRKPLIQGLKKISRPGLRRYVASSDIPVVRSGMGLGILSTSKGILTDKEARQQKVGGEYLCSVW